MPINPASWTVDFLWHQEHEGLFSSVRKLALKKTITNLSKGNTIYIRMSWFINKLVRIIGQQEFFIAYLHIIIANHHTVNKMEYNVQIQNVFHHRYTICTLANRAAMIARITLPYLRLRFELKNNLLRT